MRVALSCLAVFVLATSVSAQTVSDDAKSAEERKICRASEAATGSIMPKRICRTKAEWAAIQAANQAETDRYLLNENLRNATRAAAPRP